MSGTLYVVATPIGNLEDVTLRALRVLREVSLIAAEDTRRTAHLLAHHGISTRSTSFHQHNVRHRLPQLLARLHQGESVALVTDAGTPGISDPGAELVDACVRAGIRVDAIPGVSAPLTAAVVSGFPLIPLTIFGFPPRRSKARLEWFSLLADLGHTATFFESPHRITATLWDASSVLGNRPIVLGRELTKLHQEFIRGTAAEIFSALKEPKGEITVVVGPTTPSDMVNDQTEAGLGAAAAKLYNELVETRGLNRRAAITEAAKVLGVSARVVYAAVERLKASGV